MRRFFVLVLVASCFTIFSKQTVTKASTHPNTPAEDPTRSYWLEAQKLAQDQVFLLNRIEQVLSSPDSDRVQAVRGQIFLHVSAVDRFLKSNFPQPNLLCTSTSSNNPTAGSSNNSTAGIAGTDAVSLEAAQVYCALYASIQDLNPLRAKLERRAAVLAKDTSPRQITQMSLMTPSRSAPSEAEPAIIGRVAKTPISKFTPTVAPAIAPPDDIVNLLQLSRQRLVRVQSVFPIETRFTIPDQTLTSDLSDVCTDHTPYDLYPSESQPFAAFLTQPNTGIARLLPADVYRTASTQNRLLPTATECFPLTTLIKRTEGLSPRLAVRVEGDRFQLIQTDLDYGFMTDLGDVALTSSFPPGVASLSATPFEKLSALPKALQFFYTYRPPSDLEAVQVDRRRFITGKVDDLNLNEPLFTQALAATNRTYLVRSIQYKVPEIIRSGRTLLPYERQRLKDLLAMPSSDLLFVFRPVSRRSDGSYTVIWRVLAKFPDPQVRNLDRYVKEY